MSDRHVDEFTERPDLRKKRAITIAVQRITVALGILYCVLTMTMLLILAYQGQEQRNSLTDCTTPSGECYKNGQRRTQEAIQALINDNELTRATVVAAVACAQDRTNVTKSDILACIEQNS
jgi:hypothetical protein